MASVKIDLGLGEQAILCARAGPGMPTVAHQRDAEKFLRRWPRTRSIAQERDYLRQLGLHLGHAQYANSSDTSEQLRTAVKSGKVTVVIERAATNTGTGGGGVCTSGPTTPPYPLAMREKAAWVAPPRTSYSSDWLPNYNDVSADDLIDYIQSVVGSARTDVAAPDGDPSTAFSDGKVFEYTEALSGGDVEELAASTNNPNYAAKMLGYERKIFGNMIHSMKDDLDLGGADNVIWHDSGDVEFEGQIIGNMHDYK